MAAKSQTPSVLNVKARSPSLTPSPGPSHRHRYRGHRRESFVPIDVAELVELRARQRTFDGAYTRTAIGSLGYTIVILRLFDERFYRIGLLYCILTAVLGVAAIIRRRHSRHDFADEYNSGRWDGANPTENVGHSESLGEQTRAQQRQPGSPKTPLTPQPPPPSSSPLTAASQRRVFGRPFVTAGWIVILLMTLVTAIQLILLGFVVNLSHKL